MEISQLFDREQGTRTRFPIDICESGFAESTQALTTVCMPQQSPRKRSDRSLII
jgi:hypothetical protein